jgi:hypothetical protein
MKIILQAGPYDRHQIIVSDDCRRFHRQGSFYEHTPDINTEGRQIFKYDEQASQGDQPSRAFSG